MSTLVEDSRLFLAKKRERVLIGFNGDSLFMVRIITAINRRYLMFKALERERERRYSEWMSGWVSKKKKRCRESVIFSCILKMFSLWYFDSLRANLQCLFKSNLITRIGQSLFSFMFCITKRVFIPPNLCLTSILLIASVSFEYINIEKREVTKS